MQISNLKTQTRDEGLRLEQELDSIYLSCRLMTEHHVLDSLQGTFLLDFFANRSESLFIIHRCLVCVAFFGVEHGGEVTQRLVAQEALHLDRIESFPPS